MKYVNHIKLGLLAIAFVSVGAVFTGCEDDITIDAADSGKLETVDGMYGYVKSAAGARELTPISLFGDEASAGHLYFELSKAAAQDVSVTFKVDAAALDAYNKSHNSAYTMYPVDKLSFANGGTATIKKGEKKSALIELAINAGGSVGATYAVAVSATANDGVEVSANNQTYIYLVKPLAAIPDSKKGSVRTLCFVEVNDENILNCGEYMMKNSNKPFFDIVSIFSANINVDKNTGRAHVYCNDKVSFILNNADKIIRPLQAKGIKVNLSLLGNHDEAGMSSLSDEAAADFAQELKAYMDIYGLDGIDFDDEWSAYSTNPSPGYEKPSVENYTRLIYECRKQMPDKLLGIYEYRGSDAPNGNVEGVTAGELVDYMCYGTYGNYGKEREEMFTGLSRDKYGPYSLMISEEIDYGWYGFSEEDMRDMKDSGYGIQVFYCPKPRENNYKYLFSTVSDILYDDEVVWSGKYYERTELEPLKAVVVDGYDYFLGEWEVASSASFYMDASVGDWTIGTAREFPITVVEKVKGESYYIYGWSDSKLLKKYPIVMDYNASRGTLTIPIPQVIHEADENDSQTWGICWGSNMWETGWEFFPWDDPSNGLVGFDGRLILSASYYYSIAPYYEKDGEYMLPENDSEYYAMSKQFVLTKK